ncbi:MAG: glycosyltransferase [Anaerolineae bacterium]|nr:glycosyltransferase [Anaerolineae bacterium]
MALAVNLYGWLARNSLISNQFHRLPYRWQLYCILQYWNVLYHRRKRGWYWCDNQLSSFPCWGGQRKGRVSVVLPVYNHAATVAQAIESVLQQGYPDIELIVVNDGSTDETSDILADYENRREVTVINQSNCRLPTALNRGFRAATGEFLTWTSADNLMHPHQLEQLVSYLQDHRDVAVVYADFALIDEDAQPVRSAAACLMRGEAGTPVVRPRREADRLNIGYECVVGPCFLYRSFLPRLIGPYNPQLEGSEDFDYWIRIHNFFPVRHLGSREPLYQYRLAGDRMSVRLKDRVRTLRRWLMEREQQFQQRLTLPVLVAVDAISMDKLAPISGRDNRLPRLTFYRIDAQSSSFDMLPQAFLLEATLANMPIIKAIKPSLSQPLILWCNTPIQDDRLSDIAAQADLLIIVSCDQSSSLSNSLRAASIRDMYELVRIFIGSVINATMLPWPV